MTLTLEIWEIPPPDTTNDENDMNTEIEKDEQTEELINDAWREHAAQYAEQYDILSKHGYTFSGITKALAKIKFIESKFYGKDYPRYLSLAFHKHQFITNGDNESAYDGLRDVSDGIIKAERLRFVTGDDITKIIKGSLSFAGARMPLDFPASLARDLIKEFAHGGKVLDPCHGWGGRLVGAMLADANEYTGVDPSNFQNDGVKEIYNTFKEYSSIQKVNIINAPFEDAEIERNYYDFALTSPPYFDTEHYIGGEQSHERYSHYDLWRDGFYCELIHKVYEALKEGCYFALQVGSQRYPLADDGVKIAKEVGFTFIEKRGTDMTNNFNEVDETHAEIVLIFKK